VPVRGLRSRKLSMLAIQTEEGVVAAQEVGHSVVRPVLIRDRRPLV
jgi:hypothetical protein